MADKEKIEEQIHTDEPIHHEGMHTLADDIASAKASGKMKPAISKSAEPFRSLASDLAHALSEKKGTVVRLAIAEEEKRKILEEGQQTFSRQNIFFIVASSVFIITGIILVVFLYLKNHKMTPTNISTLTLPSYVFTDINLTVDVSTETNVSQILHDVFTSTETGTIIGVYPIRGNVQTGTLVPFTELAQALGFSLPFNAPGVFSQYAMLGYSDIGEVRSPFLILKNSSYETADNILRTWEPTLYEEMSTLIVQKPETTLFGAEFSNAIIRNKDARVIRDINGTIVFFYVFLDKYTVLFGDNPEVVGIALDRFNAEQLLK